MTELRLELLLGRSVIAQNGRRIGHIEEVCATEDGERCFIEEFHLGRYAVVERLAAWRIARSIARVLGRGRSYRVPWSKLDLSDPDKPRLLCSVDELVELKAD